MREIYENFHASYARRKPFAFLNTPHIARGEDGVSQLLEHVLDHKDNRTTVVHARGPHAIRLFMTMQKTRAQLFKASPNG